jgi:hypothetical protein
MVLHDAPWRRSRALLNVRASSPTEINRSPVPATGDSNRGRSLSGNGNARTTDIVAVVRIPVRDLNRPARRCARPTRPTNAMTT